MPLRSSILALIAFASFAESLPAQVNTAPNMPALSVVPGSGPIAVPLIANAPFSGLAIAETTKPGTNGPSKTSQTSTFIARDSDGRVRREIRDPDANLANPITISDPVAHTRTVLNPTTMEATVFSLATAVQPPSVAGYQLPLNAEDLGVSMLQGLTIHGYRLPDSSNPSFTQESWFADQLQMVVKSTRTFSDGRTQSDALTQVSLNEPDKSLFLIPTDYKVTDTAKAIRIGSDVAESNLINRVEPEYPALAKSARVQGTVEFNATIGADGLVKNLQLVRGHPLLVNAARNAVMQWKYNPTLFDGMAVVMTSITVSFSLPDQN